MSKLQGKVSIGVGLAPLVVCKKEAVVGEKIPLQYISGLTYSGVTWTSDETTIVETDSDNTVTFNEPGTYHLIVLGHPQHQSYSITVSE